MALWSFVHVYRITTGGHMRVAVIMSALCAVVHKSVPKGGKRHT